MNKVVVFQTWGIGDMIMSTPMLGALRRELPQTHITIVAGTVAAAKVVEGSSLCDDVLIMLPGSLGWVQLIKSFYNFRRQNYDAAIISTGLSPRIPLLLRLISGLKVIAGDSLINKTYGYTHWCSIDPNLHRTEVNLNILRTIFPEAQGGDLYFHHDANSAKEANDFWSKYELNNKPVLGIHPGGTISQKNKRFPLGKFLRVINMFLDQFSAARILIFLGADDIELRLPFSEIDKRVILVHDLSLNVIGKIISKIKVLLSGDTGLGHIAAAMKVPVVTLAGPTNTRYTKPLGGKNVVIRTLEDVSCMPCYGTKKYDSCRDSSCLKLIQEDQIIEALSSFFI